MNAASVVKMRGWKGRTAAKRVNLRESSENTEEGLDRRKREQKKFHQFGRIHNKIREVVKKN